MDNSYKKLDAYIMAKDLVKMVYDATKRFPDEEKFVLCNQIRRAAISVPSNIAEGLSRSAVKEQCHFLDIAFGKRTNKLCKHTATVNVTNKQNRRIYQCCHSHIYNIVFL